jgi:hypothetical protein
MVTFFEVDGDSIVSSGEITTVNDAIGTAAVEMDTVCVPVTFVSGTYRRLDLAASHLHTVAGIKVDTIRGRIVHVDVVE